jgi:hypothetical protein
MSNHWESGKAFAYRRLMTRFVDDQNAEALEAGGSFTMGASTSSFLVQSSLTRASLSGFVNQSLYTGDIDFQNVPSGQESWWILPVTGECCRPTQSDPHVDVSVQA